MKKLLQVANLKSQLNEAMHTIEHLKNVSKQQQQLEAQNNAVLIEGLESKISSLEHALSLKEQTIVSQVPIRMA